jgi:NADPH:quinone reductase-like Zn-dependent oxidoreductase
MRAAVYERYGPPEVVKITDVEKPKPKDDEVLIRIRATTITRADHRLRALDVPTGFGLPMRLATGIFKPRQPILGSELAGDLEAVGAQVRTFQVGDPVFAFADLGLRCHAEYRCMPASGALARKPSNLTYEQAAALSFGGTTALHFLRKAKLARGEKVLINGASGAVGTACVQVARHLGAEVTGVCSTANMELVESLGATHVIDYTAEDFTRNGRTYDVIVDTVGTAPLSRSKASLSHRGRLVLILVTLPQMLGIPLGSMTSKKKVISGIASGTGDDLRSLAGLAEARAFTPVIDRTYPFEQIVEAHRYVDTGRKKGNVVVTLASRLE